MKIKNPVLPGFNADPSIIRVEDTYYIANSTFDAAQSLLQLFLCKLFQ